MVEGKSFKSVCKMNIMFIGDKNVGKTELISMFDTRLIDKQFMKTVGVDKVVTE